MGKRKNLNGIPNTLVQQYFSTLYYFQKGYMADWIWNAANEININEIEIDVLNSTVEPKKLEIKPILSYLYKLRNTTLNTLNSNGFPNDYIIEIKFKIFISNQFKSQKLLTCQAFLKDKENNIYVGKTYTEKSFENSFQVYKKSILEKIISLLK
jgi:hypothetical protein